MPETFLDTSTSEPFAVVGETGGDGHASLPAPPEQVELETLEDLLSNRGRYRLREMADVMKESGALRIKDHRTIQGNNPDTFKGEYAKDWILRNEKLVNSTADAIKVAQAMLDLNIFHSITHNSVFDCKNLYAFRDPGTVGGLSMLKNRIVAIEDHNIAQTKANKEAQAEAVAKTVQLDWRVSVAERRLEATEATLRRALVVQQVVLATLLIVLVLFYAPIWANVAVFVMSLVAVLLVVVLLESRSILRDFLHLKVDYKRIANGIMGIAPDDDDDDGLSAGRLDTRDSQSQAFAMLLTAARGLSSDAATAFLDGWKHLLDVIKLRRESAPASVEKGAGSNSNMSGSGKQPQKARKSRVSLSGATRLLDCASGRLNKALRLDDRCNGLRRQSAPVQCSTDLDVPVWAGATTLATRAQVSATQQPQNQLHMEQRNAMAGPPSQRDFDEWWNGDMVVRQPAGDVRLVKPASTRGRIRVNYGDCHQFDGPLFSGKISVWIKGLPLGEDTPDVFNKFRRRTWIVVQGRFKECVPVSQVYTGQAFQQPLELVPKHVMRAALVLLHSFTRVFSSSSIIQHRGAPMVMYPLILGAQVVNVSTPGHEPDMADLNISDDVRLLAPQLVGAGGSGPASESSRRAYFSKDANRQATVFDPKHVFTFHVRQHIVDVANYRLPTTLGTINLLSYLKGQPLRFMAVDVETQRHLWNLEAWHRQLLHDNGKGNLGEGESSHGASASVDSVNDVRSVASPTAAAQGFSPTAASFGSDSPLAVSGTSNEAFDDRSIDSPAQRHIAAPAMFQSCSLRGDTALVRQSSEEPHYSAVNIVVPGDHSQANSSTAVTPKPFLDQPYPIPPSSEGQQLRSRLLAATAGSASCSSRAANILFSTAPPGGVDSIVPNADTNAVVSETASETAQSSDICATGPISLSSLQSSHAQRPSSRASVNDMRADASHESNVSLSFGQGHSGVKQKPKKTKLLTNPFRRTGKKSGLGS